MSAGHIVAVVPAAGSGSRMGADRPKQFLPLNDSTVLQCTINRLFSVSAITQVVLVTGSADQLPEDLKSDTRVSITRGGDTRSQSVNNGLAFCINELQHTGCVLVHDAARPCVRAADINQLISEVGDSDNGGLLAIPAYDTLKKSDGQGIVIATVDRADVWRAVTPQLFQVKLLAAALERAAASGDEVTDESSAMEQSGYKPRLIPSAQDNIKITVSADLQLAQSILEAQERE